MLSPRGHRAAPSSGRRPGGGPSTCASCGRFAKGQRLAVGRAGDVAGTVSSWTLLDYVTDRWSNAYFQVISPDFYAFNPQAVKGGIGVAAAMLLASLLLYLGMRRGSRWGVLLRGLLGAGVTLAVTFRDQGTSSAHGS